jgi:hypothetical protein
MELAGRGGSRDMFSTGLRLPPLALQLIARALGGTFFTAMTPFRLLPGLPPYGDLPRSFPDAWGRLGREGTVVEFSRSDGSTWIGNFCPGLARLSGAYAHPDGRHVLVYANGDAWSVDPETGDAERIMVAVEEFWRVSNPDGHIMSRQGLALLRLGPDGIMWHTRRLSWDGFSELRVDDSAITGLAWDAPGQRWAPFKVDPVSGRSTGASYFDGDPEEWETLFVPRSAT